MGTTHYERVADMMRGFGQAVPEVMGIPDGPTRRLRVRLLLEEVLELAEASGVLVRHKGIADRLEFDDLVIEVSGEADLVGVADALSDISVVNTGAFIAYGLPMEPLLELVDKNNLLKIANGKKDEHGKFVKHPDHQPPDFKGLLNYLYEVQQARRGPEVPNS